VQKLIQLDRLYQRIIDDLDSPSAPSASKPLEVNLKREQNPRYRHRNGLIGPAT
jgi:hypothetical protein